MPDTETLRDQPLQNVPEEGERSNPLDVHLSQLGINIDHSAVKKTE